MNTIKIFFFIVLFSVWNTSFAQLKEKYEYGFGIGFTNYKGDISPQLRLGNIGIGVDGFLRLNFKKGLSWRNGASIMFLKGKDENSKNLLNKSRGLQFSTTVFSAQTILEYHFLDFGVTGKSNYSPYILAGLGAMYFSSDLAGKKTTGIQFILPFGVGVKKMITKDFSAAVEFITYKTATDLLDSVKEGIVTIGKEEYDFGQIQGTDTYYYLGVNLSFRILSVTCPAPSVNF